MPKVKRPTLRTGLVINAPGRQTSLAAGYWGHTGPKGVMVATQIPERIIKSNRDLVKMGVLADIWVAPVMNLDTLPACGCVKTTNQSADVKCAKCHGLKRIPGYVKWGYDTFFFSAVALGLTAQPDAGITIPSTFVKNTTTTLHTLGLANGVLTSSFETHDFAVDNVYSTNWEMQALVYNRDRGNSNSVEWSLDRGTTWLSGDFKQLSLTRGTIRFRITLSRLSVDSLSPQFEILRFRYPSQKEPWVRIARPMGKRKRKREEFGKTEDESGLNYWTPPLPDGGKATVNGQVVYNKVWLPNDFFFQILEGTFVGDRYVTVSYARSEHIGVMTSQSFDVRRVLENEIQSVLW